MPKTTSGKNGQSSTIPPLPSPPHDDPAMNVDLVSEREVVPEDHHLLIQIIVDGVRTVGGDRDALPLGAPVLDPVQSHDGFALR